MYNFNIFLEFYLVSHLINFLKHFFGKKREIKYHYDPVRNVFQNRIQSFKKKKNVHYRML